MTTLLSPLNTRPLETAWLADLSCPNVKSVIVVTGVTHPNVMEGLRILHIHSNNRGNLILLLHPWLEYCNVFPGCGKDNFVFTLISYLLLLVFIKNPHSTARPHWHYPPETSHRVREQQRLSRAESRLQDFLKGSCVQLLSLALL